MLLTILTWIGIIVGGLIGLYLLFNLGLIVCSAVIIILLKGEKKKDKS